MRKLRQRLGWLILAAIFLALNALLFSGLRDGDKAGAIQASALNLGFH